MKIIIPKDFYKPFKAKIKLPTIKCKVCGKKILDTPTNRVNNQ